jgi:hypothetical protein
MSNPLEIANWEDGFEIAQSRRRSGRLSWVAMPTRHDSRGYRKLIRSKGGVKHFACWCVLVQVSARCSVRGVLADDRGLALTSDDFEAMTDIPASDFESAIPILVDVGWIIQPSSYDTPSVVGAQSENGMSTVQDRTIQNKTKQKQYITGLKNQHRSIQTQEIKKRYDKIQSKKRRGYKLFCSSFISEVFNNDIDPDFVIEAVIAYYESEEGKCPYFREPTRLIDDHIWEEDRESWTRKDRNDPPKPVDESVNQESFERIFSDE